MKNNLIGISGKIGSGKDTVGIILQGLSEEASVSSIKYVVENSFDNPPPGAYQVKKFAGKLKDIACLLLGCTREQLEDREFKEKELGEEWLLPKGVGIKQQIQMQHLSPTKSLTPRKLLQLLGTEAGRQVIHPNIWVNALFADYKNNFTPCEHWEKDRENINCMCGGINAMGANKGITNCESEGKLPNWIITDVRFPNEAQAIKDRGGIVIRVNRWIDRELTKEEALELFHNEKEDVFGVDCNGVESLIEDVKRFNDFERFVTEKLPNYHPSETGLDDYEFDHVIDNNGSIEELIEKVKQLKLV